MKVITTRVEEKDVKDLMQIERVEKAERAKVVRKLLSKGISDWKKRFAIEKLKNRGVSIARAAEIASVSFADMIDLMSKENIDIGYSLKDLEKDFAGLKRK